jgi:hypothetical protein
MLIGSEKDTPRSKTSLWEVLFAMATAAVACAALFPQRTEVMTIIQSAAFLVAISLSFILLGVLNQQNGDNAASQNHSGGLPLRVFGIMTVVLLSSFQNLLHVPSFAGLGLIEAAFWMALLSTVSIMYYEFADNMRPPPKYLRQARPF